MTEYYQAEMDKTIENANLGFLFDHLRLQPQTKSSWRLSDVNFYWHIPDREIKRLNSENKRLKNIVNPEAVEGAVIETIFFVFWRFYPRFWAVWSPLSKGYRVFGIVNRLSLEHCEVAADLARLDPVLLISVLFVYEILQLLYHTPRIFRKSRNETQL